MLDINDLRSICKDENIAITKHARSRLAERNITVSSIQSAILTGEIIKQYEDDKPFPSCLLLGRTEKHEYIHVVASVNGGYLYIVTAYFPDPTEWEADFKTRKG